VLRRIEAEGELISNPDNLYVFKRFEATNENWCRHG
jgi:hypothetical protein